MDRVRMSRVEFLAKVRRLGLSVAVLALAGCSSIPGAKDPGDTLGNLMAFNSPTAPPIQQAKADLKVNCPIVDVNQGGSAVRVGGATSGSVRYQYSLGDIARDCSVENNQIVMRVGIEGKVLLGPAGAPSSFTVPVKVTVRRESDEKIIETKVYRVAASIPSGAAQSSFSVVTDPLRMPYLGEDAFDDYMVFVGFEGSGQSLPASKRRRRG